MKLLKLLWLLCLLVPLQSTLYGQYLKVSKKSNIRQQPSSQSAVIEIAQQGQYLILLDEGDQMEGYYHVQCPTFSETGWIYRTMVRRYQGDTPLMETEPVISLSVSIPSSDARNRYAPNIPVDYYQTAEGLEGHELKANIHRIIRGHKRYGYDELWNLLPITDADPQDENNLILLYTLRSQNKAYRDRGGSFVYADAGYLYADAWNREHVWAKSRGFPQEKDTAFTDLHHLRPADRSVNTSRNNRNFDYADDPYFDNGITPTESKVGSEDWVWEPPDEVKGDIARMIFYMAVRYEGNYYNGVKKCDLEVVDSIPSGDNKDPVIGKLSTLLEWHKKDPVSDWERRRNDIIFTYQGNRNPFIDHPEWVEKIW
jgi:endonuclease I